MPSLRCKQLLKMAAAFCCLAIFYNAASPVGYSQAGSVGVVSIVATDPTGAAIPDAVLELKDLDATVVHRGAAQANGGLNIEF